MHDPSKSARSRHAYKCEARSYPTTKTRCNATGPVAPHILFFFNDTATTEIYTLSLHDALPIYHRLQHDRGEREPQTRDRAPLLHRRQEIQSPLRRSAHDARPGRGMADREHGNDGRSEEHTSELQSLAYLVCRLLLEKKKKKK